MTDYANQFEPTQGIYLLNHSVGRPPLGIKDLINQSFFDTWRDGSPDPWPTWLEIVSDFRASLAALLNAHPQEVCPQANLSSGFTKLLQSLPISESRSSLLVSPNDFPSMGFVAQQAAKWGIELRWLPEDFAFTDAQAWQQEITDDLLAVFVSHVHYNSNTRVPVAEIAKAAREKSVFCIVDIAQSVGIVPIDLSEWQADAVLGSCVKWLCGGPGAGFLWLSEHAITNLAPKDVGWFSHRNPFEFDIRNFEYAEDALRFWGGTPSVLPFDVARHSLKHLQKIGIETIYSHNRALASVLLDAVDESYIVSPLADSNRGGTLVVNPPNRQSVEARLIDAEVKFDARAMGIRLSPHIYNNHAEMELVASCLSAE